MIYLNPYCDLPFGAQEDLHNPVNIPPEVVKIITEIRTATPGERLLGEYRADIIRSEAMDRR